MSRTQSYTVQYPQRRHVRVGQRAAAGDRRSRWPSPRRVHHRAGPHAEAARAGRSRSPAQGPGRRLPPRVPHSTAGGTRGESRRPGHWASRCPIRHPVSRYLFLCAGEAPAPSRLDWCLPGGRQTRDAGVAGGCHCAGRWGMAWAGALGALSPLWGGALVSRAPLPPWTVVCHRAVPHSCARRHAVRLVAAVRTSLVAATRLLLAAGTPVCLFMS